jgi:hypothetical protein
MIQELENPVILVHEKKISSLNSIIPVLELVVQVSHHHLFHAILKVLFIFHSFLFLERAYPDQIVFFRIKGHC